MRIRAWMCVIWTGCVTCDHCFCCTGWTSELSVEAASAKHCRVRVLARFGYVMRAVAVCSDAIDMCARMGGDSAPALAELLSTMQLLTQRLSECTAAEPARMVLQADGILSLIGAHASSCWSDEQLWRCRGGSRVFRDAYFQQRLQLPQFNFDR